MIRSRWMIARALDVVIRPPLGVRAKPAIARSTSPASRGLTAVSSNPSDGAAAWIAPNWPVPAEIGIADDGDPRHSWRNLLELLQPFCAQTVFKTDKACDVTTWPRQAIDEASADRIDNVREHNWHSARRFQ